MKQDLAVHVKQGDVVSFSPEQNALTFCAAHRDEFLYLTPSCAHYNLVNIRRFEADQWFCTEAQAKKAGFKLSPDCQIKWTDFFSNSPKK